MEPHPREELELGGKGTLWVTSTECIWWLFASGLYPDIAIGVHRLHLGTQSPRQSIEDIHPSNVLPDKWSASAILTSVGKYSFHIL